MQFEGVDNNHRTGLLTILIPPIEALQNVDVSTSNYEAELGRAGGAVTNVILKSGTNSIHGGAVRVPQQQPPERARDLPAVQAGDHLQLLRRQSSAAPIIKNKTFIFGDYLRIADRRGDGYIITVPSAAFRAGDFSSQTARGRTTRVPATASPASGRTPFAGNKIPDCADQPDREEAARLRAAAQHQQQPDQ